MRFEDNPSLNPEILGQRIRQARENLRLSQEDLAALVKKDQRAISEYENGRRRLSATDLPTFARVLEVPIMYFYEGEIGEQSQDDEILHEFHRLQSDQIKTAAIDIVRVLANLQKFGS